MATKINRIATLCCLMGTLLSYQANAERGCIPYYDINLVTLYGVTGASVIITAGAIPIFPQMSIVPVSIGVGSVAVASDPTIVRSLLQEAHNYVKKEDSHSKKYKFAVQLKLFQKALQLSTKKSSYQQIAFNELSVSDIARHIHNANQKHRFCKKWPFVQNYLQVIKTVKKEIIESYGNNIEFTDEE